MIDKNIFDYLSLIRLAALKIVFSIYLILNVVPLFVRNHYETITFLNYSFVLAVLLLLSITPTSIYKRLTFVVFLFFSSVFVAFGKSGSIFALSACSILPILIFDSFRRIGDAYNFFFLPILIAAIVSIIAAFFVFSQTYNILTEFFFLGEYFEIASINYVPLTLFNIAVIFFLILKLKKEGKSLVYPKIVLLLLTILCIVASFIYLTKTTLFGSFYLLILQLKRKHAYLLIGVIVILIFKYQNLILDGFVAFMGADPSEVTLKDDRRYESGMLFVNDAINLKYNYRDNQSFSTLLNLLFSIFPISLVMILPLISVVIKFRIKYLDQFSVFLVLLFLTSYQMDFLSIFTLYFISMFIFHFNKYSIVNG